MGVAFALVVLLSGSAEAVLTHYWNFEETNNTPAPQVKDLPGTQDGNFGGNLGNANRSADVPTGIGSTRSLDFGPGNANPPTNTINYVDVYTPSGSSLELPTTNNWTVSLWYKGTDAGGAVVQRVLVGAYGSYGQLELGTGGKVEFAHLNGGWGYIVSTVSVNDDVWHNITLVNHGISQTADLYVDAALQGAAGQDSSTAGGTFFINTFMTWGAVTHTSGKLDDVKVYDNALTAAEVYFSIPEPSTMALVGLAGLLAWRRNR